MRNAFAWFEGQGIEYRMHDYKKEGVPAARLRAWVKKAGWEAILSTRGPTFRRLLPARQKNIDADKAVALMEEFPSAIRRPVIEGGKSLIVGFDAAAYQAAFK